MEKLGSLLKILNQNSEESLGVEVKDLDVIDKEVTARTEETLLKPPLKKTTHILRPIYVNLPT